MTARRLVFSDADPTGHAIGKQATKVDLVDIARAIGLPGANYRYTVPELRAAIRARLQQLVDEGKL